MTNTNCTYYNEATISKTRASFKVELEEHDITIFVPTTTAAAICENTTDDEAMIATLLAYIEVTRKEAITEKVKFRKIKEELLIVNISELLGCYPVEQLIEIVRELKWHQVKEVFESEKPTEELERFV